MAFNILIVDDSAMIRKTIERTIHLAAAPVGNIFHAGNGVEALDFLKSEWIDLVFLDINMPVMDGMALLEQMREDDVMSIAPVVVVSTEGSDTKKEKLTEMGVKAFVRKPFMPEKIREAIHAALGEWDETDVCASTDSF